MDQQFSLSWNNFHGNLSKGFAGLLGKGEFVDVTIAVDGHLLQAHKVILSICSPYFKKMFQMNPCQHPIVVLRDVTHKAMRDLLQFMYHGEVSVKREDLTSFIGTAEVLQIKGLTNKETDEDEEEQKQTLPNHNVGSQKNTAGDTESSVSDTTDTQFNENVAQNEVNALKQRNLLERLHDLSNFKRKSEDFIHNTYYNSEALTEKRPRLTEKSVMSKNSVQSNYENMYQLYEEVQKDVSKNFISHSNQNHSTDKDHDSNKFGPISPDATPVDFKTECEDEPVVTDDPSLKHYTTTEEAPDYPATQDNCSGLNTLFADLKNLVNGKAPVNLARVDVREDYTSVAMDHRLTTIPQKEDGKKKYPQRSCRLCWKIGKRRDTRFMCSTCELPFCKAPCFEIHFNDIMAKVTQIHNDYYTP